MLILGYYNVCHLGGEIKNPGKNIPRSIFISIIGISTLVFADEYKCDGSNSLADSKVG